MSRELIALSAPTAAGLRPVAEAWVEHLAGIGGYFDLADLSYTSLAAQQHADARLAAWGEDHQSVAAALEAWLDGQPGAWEQGSAPHDGVAALLVTGDRASWRAVEPLLRGHSRFDELRLAVEWWPERDGVGSNDLTVFALQVGLVRLWEDWGVTPEAIVPADGLAAAAARYLAGAIALPDALEAVHAGGVDPDPEPALDGQPVLVVGPGDGRAALPGLGPRDTLVVTLARLFADGVDVRAPHAAGRIVRIPRILWVESEPAAAGDGGEPTRAERWLREELRRATGREPQQIDLRDPLGRLGIDSLRLVELRAAAREQWSASLSLSELSELTGERLAELISARAANGASAAHTNGGKRAAPSAGSFPLTEIQGAYLAGRSTRLPLGGVMCHMYFEVEVAELDPSRLNRAVTELVRRHEMLRTVAPSRNGQVTLERVPPFEVEVVRSSAGGEAQRRRELEAQREALSHRVSDPASWPLFRIRAVVFDHGPAVVQFSFDMLTVDADSVRLIGEELSALYADPRARLPAPGRSFADHTHAEAESRTGAAYDAARRYWGERLAELPLAPALPVLRSLERDDPPRFNRRQLRLDAAAWRSLASRARDEGVTASALLCAAFGEVLRRWSERPEFVVTVTTSTRYASAGDASRTVGEYTSPLLLEHDGRGDCFVERARRLQARMWSDLEHGSFSSIELLRELARLRPAEMPVVPVVFTSFLGQSAGDRPSLFDAYGGLGRTVFALTQTPQVYLDHQVWESDGELVACWDVVEDMFPPGMVDEMFRAYDELLARLAAEPDRWTQESSTLAACQEPDDWQATLRGGEPAVPALLHERLDAQCRARPDDVAVVAGPVRLTYRQLDATATAAAAKLAAAGATRNRLVGIVLPKGWEQVAAVLAVLRAGAAYLPIDPELPPRRIEYMLERGEVDIVLTRADVERRWPDRIHAIDVGGPLDSAPPQPRPRAEPGDLAYVIFTSGSTGTPKGVAITHSAAANTVHDLQDRYRLDRSDAILGLSALGFDLSVFDVFGPLGVGGRLVLPVGADARQPAAWLTLVSDERVTIWNTVPALMVAMVEHLEARDARMPSQLRLVMLSGDWIPVTLPDRIRARSDGAPELYSLGGATEASIWSIHYPIGEVPPQWPSIPYGRALARQGVHVLDGNLEPRPRWVPGDLYVTGAGLAQGYWRDREKTAAAFLRHPRHGIRLYRTGDQGRYLGDRNIEFLGRNDGQVKLNGFRVELGEVEATLARHPGVSAAVAQALDSPRGRRVLVAYVVAARGADPSDAELRDHVGEFLPAYARPAMYVRLERLPLTANGKLDRAGLPSPWEGAASIEAAHAERDDALVELIREVLSFDELDLDRDFGELGVDSLDVIAVIDAVQARWGVDVALGDVNSAESFREFLAAVSPLLPDDLHLTSDAYA